MPAPFGPSSPTTSPRCTETLTPRSTGRRLKLFPSPCPCSPRLEGARPRIGAIVGDKPRSHVVGPAPEEAPKGRSVQFMAWTDRWMPILCAAAGLPTVAVVASWRTNSPSTRGAGSPGLAATVIMRLTLVLRSRTAYWPLMTFCPRADRNIPQQRDDAGIGIVDSVIAATDIGRIPGDDVSLSVDTADPRTLAVGAEGPGRRGSAWRGRLRFGWRRC